MSHPGIIMFVFFLGLTMAIWAIDRALVHWLEKRKSDKIRTARIKSLKRSMTGKA